MYGTGDGTVCRAQEFCNDMTLVDKEIRLVDHASCTGCMACRQKCKRNAISVIYEKGFAFPYINQEMCVGCGRCVQACPVLNVRNVPGNTHEKESVCLAAWNKDAGVRMKSSSGGAFSAMAEKVLAQKGVVFGAAWDERMNLRHKYVGDVAELDSLRRSKYVQSDTLDTFNEVRDFLKEGRAVLYCGTPCQIAGLTSFLDYKDYSNLVKVDVVCQGVPSGLMLKKYISEIERKHGVKVLDANFRSKTYGWRCGLLLLLLVQKGNRRYWMKRVFEKNEYYNSFIKEYFMRESCYACPFKCNRHGYYSDISIADFWRIGKTVPLNVDDYEKGISAVIVNTEKGRAFFKSCVSDLEVIERTWDEFMTNGGMYPCHKRKDNDKAYEFLSCHSWRETQKRYFPYAMKARLRTALYLGLGEKTIRKLMKLMGRKV